MAPQEPSKQTAPAADPDFDATDGGWDPYVTSLLLGPARSHSADDAEDGAPVMSFSQVPRPPAGR